jgi:ribosomal protein S17E
MNTLGRGLPQLYYNSLPQPDPQQRGDTHACELAFFLFALKKWLAARQSIDHMVEGGLPESDVADASILEIQEHTKELLDRNKEMNITLGSNWNDNQRSALSEVKEQFEKETGSLRNSVAGWIKQAKHAQQNPIAAEPGPRTHVLPL